MWGPSPLLGNVAVGSKWHGHCESDPGGQGQAQQPGTMGESQPQLAFPSFGSSQRVVFSAHPGTAEARQHSQRAELVVTADWLPLSSRPLFLTLSIPGRDLVPETLAGAGGEEGLAQVSGISCHPSELGPSMQQKPGWKSRQSMEVVSLYK